VSARWDAATLSHADARRAYDRIGAKQDTQAFYEDRATGELVAHLRLGEARSVFEFGCGTGRFAARLLAHHLPGAARYRAVDVSPTMVALARRRLLPFASRVEVTLTDGSPHVDEPDASVDRFVSTFVLDLLSRDDAAAVVGEAHRMLVPGGLVGLASATTGFNVPTRLVEGILARVHAWRPALVGGCRGIELLDLLAGPRWTIHDARRLSAFGIPMQVVVAEPIRDAVPDGSSR
jgi:SAM-dependent methyltransferase